MLAQIPMLPLALANAIDASLAWKQIYGNIKKETLTCIKLVKLYSLDSKRGLHNIVATQLLLKNKCK